MKITKIKFFKIKKSYKKENFKVNPNIYWEILVIFSLLAIIISFIFSYNLFIQTNKNNVGILKNDNGKTVNTEKERIKNALDYFSQREKKSTEILNSPVPVVDPSL